MCDMTRSCIPRTILRKQSWSVWYDVFIHDMTLPYVWHDSSIHVAHESRRRSTNHFATIKLKCVMWRIHTYDMTHSYVWHDSFIRVTHENTWRSTTHFAAIMSNCVTWLIHMCVVPHSYVWRDSFICVNPYGVTPSYVWHASHTRTDGVLRSILRQ